MNQQRLTRILIADRQPAVRAAVRIFVEKQPGLEMVGEAADTQELLALVRTTCPDLVLLDWGLNARPSSGLLQTLHEFDWQPRVIVLDVRPESQKAALAAGADAFVSKTDPPIELLTAIQAALLVKGNDEQTGCAGLQ
jgi:DNA-binding NarL/FixJ family response regulator